MSTGKSEQIQCQAAPTSSSNGIFYKASCFINNIKYRFEKSKTYKKAKEEFGLLKKEWKDRGAQPDDMPIVLEFEKDILKLIDKFGKSGQSGGSAPFYFSAISNTIKKLCMHEALSPLTGEESEWGEKYSLGTHSMQQNKRNSAVFKKEDGTCDYISAVVFQGEDKYDTFTGEVEGVHSCLKIKSFPFIPKTFYIDVTRERNDTDPDRVSCGDGDYLYRIKDRSQLEAVKELYIL